MCLRFHVRAGLFHFTLYYAPQIKETGDRLYFYYYLSRFSHSLSHTLDWASFFSFLFLTRLQWRMKPDRDTSDHDRQIRSSSLPLGVAFAHFFAPSSRVLPLVLLVILLLPSSPPTPPSFTPHPALLIPTLSLSLSLRASCISWLAVEQNCSKVHTSEMYSNAIQSSDKQ